MERDMNHPERAQRLFALRELLRMKPIHPESKPEYANNHIHTTYSFSPYSPTMAAYKAWESGLTTAGIMDHDTAAGAEEFIEAAQIIGIAHTVGFECRCLMTDTPFAGKRLNNPDQRSVAYVAMHGIPHQHISTAQAFLSGYRAKRELRNQAMVEKLNAVIAPCDISLDYAKDIVSISQAHDGGAVTERHILYALAGQLIGKYGEGRTLVQKLRDTLGIPVSAAQEAKLSQGDPWIAYHLLGLLKSNMVEKFYIDATDECPHILEFTKLANEIGAIPAYAYLGDVQNSVTGDKKDQTFEDAFLDELVRWLAQAGFKAITFMPSRNTPAQLARIMRLCQENGLFQISGEDINSPFQSFICPQLSEPAYRPLVIATWALIGHEAAATKRQQDGMFSAETLRRMPLLDERIAYYARLGHEAFEKEEKQ